VRSFEGKEDSDRDCGVLHGNCTEMTPNSACFRRFNVVTILHSVLTGSRARSGLGLPEVIVAVTVLGAGVLGVAAIGGAARRMANVAAVRSAQTLAAGQVLEGVPALPHPAFGVAVDTVMLGPGLIELRVTVGGASAVGALSWVARQPGGWP
jgi:hypothetical protein